MCVDARHAPSMGVMMDTLPNAWHPVMLAPWRSRVLRDPEEAQSAPPHPSAVDDGGEPMVMIHGDLWKVAHVVDAVARCRTVSWTPKTWDVEEVLIPRNWDPLSSRHDEVLDPEDLELVPDVWSHEHCEICNYRVDYRDEHRQAFAGEDGSWICAECRKLPRQADTPRGDSATG